ncbi:flavin reductase [candidate division WOR-3 bacterium]|nr:flavin reductase [candidate division WOR-3 bacterium]
MDFKEIKARQIKKNLFKLIADDWALICAGKENDFNMMTASWGTFGELWHRKIAIIFIRPQRYTHEFIEKSNIFSINFFNKDKKDALKKMGSVSGRDFDKMHYNKLTPIIKHNTVFFEESKLVIICKKIYYDDVNNKHFLDKTIEKNYPEQDYHRFYIGEIEKVLIKEQERKN